MNLIVCIDMFLLGISAFFHDSSVVLLRNGVVVAAIQEERLSRIKHDNQFPLLAIQECLRIAGIRLNQVDLVVFYEKPIIKFERVICQHLEYFPKSYTSFLDNFGSWMHDKFSVPKIMRKLGYKNKIIFVPHHLSHAASSYYLSGFSEAAIVVIDGVGEWATTSIGYAKNQNIILEQEIRFPHSLGLLYSTFTAYLGFKVNEDEYKVMGLSAYGNPSHYAKHFNQVIRQFNDGSYTLNMDLFDYGWAGHMPSQNLVKIFGLPVRKPDEPVLDVHADIAASLQATLERVVYKLLTVVSQKYRTTNLCLSGGVALNSLMNGKIVSNTPFRELYIPTDPGDGGGALGAALFASQQFGGDNSKLIFSPYLGAGYTTDEILGVLQQFKSELWWQKVSRKQLLDDVSEMLIDGKIIAWYQGRMEWGPRALGARSILASATSKEMKDVINLKIKKREQFRPFAPAILSENVKDYFDVDNPLSLSSHYMLLVYPFKKKGRKLVPAVVHKDKTGRLQVVSRNDNPLYYDLIHAYYKKTSIPVIINTSFNVQEPIVNSPFDAVMTFLKTDIDCMAIGPFLVYRKND